MNPHQDHERAAALRDDCLPSPRRPRRGEGKGEGPRNPGAGRLLTLTLSSADRGEGKQWSRLACWWGFIRLMNPHEDHERAAALREDCLPSPRRPRRGEDKGEGLVE